jgi:hypothetical protein
MERRAYNEVKWEVVRDGKVIQSGCGSNTSNATLFNAVANWLAYTQSTKPINRVSVVSNVATTYCTLTKVNLTPPPYGHMWVGSHTCAATETVSELNLIYYDGVNADVEYCTYTPTSIVMSVGDILNFSWTDTLANKTGDQGTTTTCRSNISTYLGTASTSAPVATALITGTGGSPYTLSVDVGTPVVAAGVVTWSFKAKNASGADDTIASVSLKNAAGTAYFTKTGLSLDWDAGVERPLTAKWTLSES